MRDQAYSVELPLIEILLKPEAMARVDSRLEGFVGKLPPGLTGTRTPSFATIVSFRMVAGMAQVDPEALDALNAELAELDVTEGDRRARCARYDDEVPDLDFVDSETNVLVFDKINGFDHGPSVGAATRAIQSLGDQMGWSVAVTDQPGAFNAETLARFDAVVWNNVSGDVLTLSQRKAFEDYINQGGGFLGIHGSGGDPLYLWDWYADTLLGARFIGHPSNPQFQDARIAIEITGNGVAEGLPDGWTMRDEWYSFGNNPRQNGARVVATLDESTYEPGESMGTNLRMGDDHPIAWTRCVNQGRAMYTAIGHRPEVYHIPENLLLLRNGLTWVAGEGGAGCKDPEE
jgi:type 1 glutamine amidotransferase